MEETGASAVEVVRAATAAMEIFHIPQFWQQVNDLDSSLSTGAQIALHLETRRLLDRATRWFLQTRGGMIDVQAEVDRFKSVVEDHTSAVPTNLLGKERERYDRLMRRFIEAGTPEDLARYAAASLDVFALLDIADICLRTGEPVDVVIPLYFTISDRYEIDSTLVKISDLPRGDRWSALARFALRSDLYSVVAGLTSRVLRVGALRGCLPGANDPRRHRGGGRTESGDVVGGPAGPAQSHRPGVVTRPLRIPHTCRGARGRLWCSRLP
jgi:glutamate dehydrogenase